MLQARPVESLRTSDDAGFATREL